MQCFGQHEVYNGHRCKNSQQNAGAFDQLKWGKKNKVTDKNGNREVIQNIIKKLQKKKNTEAIEMIESGKH